MKPFSILALGMVSLAVAQATWAEEGRKVVVKVDASAPAPGGPVFSYADVLESSKHAVVSVSASRMLHKPAGSALERKESGMGSGVLLSADGYILTNHHVAGEADQIEITLFDQRTFKAKLVGTDPKTDVAVLKIDGENLPNVTLADSEKLRVGDVVFALGNPLGLGQTVTMGIISATERRVGLLSDVAGYENFIQTDAAINQGNSGGALVDARGRLIGINTAILSPTKGSIGIGFAIPINLARLVMNSLVETGKVTRGYLGVQVDPLTAELAETLGLPRDTRGVLVADVTAEGPAQQAGIEKYDTILSINEHAVAATQDLRLVVSQLAPDSTASVKLLRNAKPLTLAVKVGKLAEVAATNELLQGVKVQGVSMEQRRDLGLEGEASGLVVVSVSADSPYNGKLASDLIILEINRVPVTDIESAKRLLVPGRNLLMVYSGGLVKPMALLVK